MSQEITASATLSANSGLITMSARTNVQLNLTSNQVMQKVQTILSASATALDVSAIVGTPQKLLILNTDPTNNVTVALDSGMSQKTDVIQPGDFIFISPFSATRYLQATTANVQVEVWGVGT